MEREALLWDASLFLCRHCTTLHFPTLSYIYLFYEHKKKKARQWRAFFHFYCNY